MVLHQNADNFREDFDIVLEQVAQGERIVLLKDGKPLAALVPVEDLNWMIQQEDETDLMAAQEALKDPERTSWKDVKAEFGP